MQTIEIKDGELVNADQVASFRRVLPNLDDINEQLEGIRQEIAGVRTEISKLNDRHDDDPATNQAKFADVDSAYSKHWQAYHRQYAILMAVHAQCNLTQKKT